MADELAPAPEAPVAEAPESSAPETTESTTSLADHQDLYGPPDPTLEGEAKAKNDEARAKVRHRAKSQQAGPEDAPRIQELTRRLRATEAERDALKTPPPARADRPLGTVAAPAAEAGVSRQAAPQIQETRPKPHVDEIGTKYESYEDFTDDRAVWLLEQREAAYHARQRDEWQQRQQSEQQQQWAQAHATYGGRLAAFTKDHPDFQTLLATSGDIVIPPAPYLAMLRADNGPALVYHLLQHPDLLAEAVLLFDGKPPSNEFVAHATRWLSSRMQAASTGSAAPTPPLTLAPRPPNPVRTGTARADGDGPGDDSMSISEHEKAYAQRKRR